jgi:hypothetical protein
METKAEYQIWDTIVNSAKTKFDYKHIRAMFKKEDDEITDKFLFHIIAGFACGENHQTIQPIFSTNYKVFILNAMKTDRPVYR